MSLALSAGGVGIGLRHPHFESLLETKPDVAFLEIHSENYFNPHAKSRHFLDLLTAYYPISCHGIGLSLGGTDPLSASHLKQLKDLFDHCQPALISEHLSWGSYGGQFFNDLLPLPYTQEVLSHFSARVDQVQNRLGRQILIENPSAYLQFKGSDMPEWELLNALSQQTGCGLLLDLNNVHVSAMNQGWSSAAYLAGINHQAVQEIHLAGFTQKTLNEGQILIDTHGTAVSEPVWQLYRQYLTQYGAVPTLIEWDTDIPDLSILLAEQQKAVKCQEQVAKHE